MGVGSEVDGGIVTKGGSRDRHGHTVLSHEAGRRVPQNVGRDTRWESGLLDGRLPDAVSPVGQPNHRAIRRREDLSFWIIGHLHAHVFLQFQQDGLGHLNQSRTMGLGVPFDELAFVLRHGSLNGQPEPSRRSASG